MNRKHYSAPIVLPLRDTNEADAKLLTEITPKPAKCYAIPTVWHETGVTRARNGQNNPITRVRVLFYSLRLAGHGRDFAERVMARFDAIIDECWPPHELGPIDAVQLEVFAVTIERQIGASKTLLATIRQLLSPQRVGA